MSGTESLEQLVVPSLVKETMMLLPYLLYQSFPIEPLHFPPQLEQKKQNL